VHDQLPGAVLRARINLADVAVQRSSRPCLSRHRVSMSTTAKPPSASAVTTTFRISRRLCTRSRLGVAESTDSSQSYGETYCR